MVTTLRRSPPLQICSNLVNAQCDVQASAHTAVTCPWFHVTWVPRTVGTGSSALRR